MLHSNLRIDKFAKARIILLLGAWLLAASANAKSPSENVNSDIVTALKNATADIENLDRQLETLSWLQVMSRNIQKRVPNHEYRFKLLRTVLDESLRVNIDPQLALSVIEIESNFNAKATSSVGAQGLMQVMPFWKNELGKPSDNLYDMQTNIRYGCEILQFYLQKYSPSVDRALAAYNGSLGKAKYPNKVLARLKQKWQFETHFSLKEPEIVAIETNTSD